MSMDRRRFLQCAGFAFAASATASCGDRGRAKVLSGIVLEVVMPASSETLNSSRQLRLTMAKLVGAPSPQSLAAVRDEWKKTILAFARAEGFPALSAAGPTEVERAL